MEAKSSNEPDLLSGVPQGTILGPLLFILFIGDIDTRFQHANALSFADDTRITMKVKQPENSNKLKENPNAVHQWAKTNKMMFHACKFEHLRYNGANPLNPLRYKAPNGSEIETETTVRDLGVTI